MSTILMVRLACLRTDRPDKRVLSFIKHENSAISPVEDRLTTFSRESLSHQARKTPVGSAKIIDAKAGSCRFSVEFVQNDGDRFCSNKKIKLWRFQIITKSG